ncbi:MAG: hypothetical protein QI199_06720 [Candidatus Korarchaeota archaeon]|nr:hypothetical protein [Candidatus Korarchaeota archaeon]
MLRAMLVCRSCGFQKDLEGSNEILPETCPSCGSRDLEFVVYRVSEGSEKGVEREVPESGVPSLIEEAFLRKVSEGEWEIDLSRTISEEVAVAELELGEYEIVFRLRRAG